MVVVLPSNVTFAEKHKHVNIKQVNVLITKGRQKKEKKRTTRLQDKTVVRSQQHREWFRSGGENYFLVETQNPQGCYGDIHTNTTPNTECDLSQRPVT